MRIFFWKIIWYLRGINRKWYERAKLKRGYSDKRVRSAIETILKKIDLKKEDIVLDLGCGDGLLMKSIASRCKFIQGIDYSGTMIRVAKNNLRNFSNVKIIKANAINLPFDNNFFTKIICIGVFMYFETEEEIRRVLEEMKRVIKPGGIIYIGIILDKTQKYKTIFFHHPKKLDFKSFFRYFFEFLGNKLNLVFWNNPKVLLKHLKELKMEGEIISSPAVDSNFVFDCVVKIPEDK